MLDDITTSKIFFQVILERKKHNPRNLPQLLGIPPTIPSALEGFLPGWIGEFYAYYQCYNNIPGAEVINKVPLDYLKKAYPGLHNLDLELAVKKVS